MAIDREIPALPNAAALDGTELFHVIQNGNSRKSATSNVLRSSQLSTDGSLAANADTLIASQKATKTYVDSNLALLTPTELLTRIKTVDGSGSGLDADLLDGQSSVFFLDRNNHTGTQPIASVTGLDAALNSKVDLAGGVMTGPLALTGVSTAPTAAADTSTTQIATTAFVQGEIADRAPINSPVFTGNPTAPTPATADNDTSLATTAFVKAQGYIGASALAPYAPLASPVFTGNPTAPTPAPGDNDTSIATTAFVQAAFGAAATVPAGLMGRFFMETPPAGWLKCNGALISRTAYATLFAAIGTVFGAGDGSTTFQLPDERGEFDRGWDDGRGIDAGRVFGSWQNHAYLNHTHTADPVAAHNHKITTSQPYSSGTPTLGNTGTTTGDISAASSSKVSYYDGGHTPSINASTSGGTETRPRNVATLVCIKY